MSDWTCDLCGAYILDGFQRQHEWWHRELRRGTRVTFTGVPSIKPTFQVQAGPPPTPMIGKDDLLRLYARLAPRRFDGIDEVEDYLNEPEPPKS